MITWRLPSAEPIATFLATQTKLQATYDNVGMTRVARPPNSKFNVDHSRFRLGSGDEVFGRAVVALRSWAMFGQGWVRRDSGGQPPEVGTNVAIIVRIGPLWWTNACRVIYVIDETTPVRRIGFANGTLPAHAECGEELFSIEVDAAGDVWYDLLAYSYPRHWLARLGYPLTRAMQRRFAIGSAAAMKRAIAETVRERH